MDSEKIDIKEMHWLVNMLQSIDVGLLVIDRQYQVQVWNSFMENHSGLRPETVIGAKLLDLFPDIPVDWFRRKTDSVFLLNSRAFTNWEQRPYLFRFRNYRPITGTSEFMFQNITFVPLGGLDGQVSHLGLIVYDVTDMAVSKSALEQANRQLEVLSRTDGLTRLYNRGYFEEQLAREYQRSKRTFQSCSLIMLDIDHFKQVNDTYGHQAGDAVLCDTGTLLSNTVRNTDFPARYGGEEFCIILIDTNGKEARLLAERLRGKVADRSLDYQGQTISWTISLGIAELSEEMEDCQQWLQCADRALYAAKDAGRNRCQLHRTAV